MIRKTRWKFIAIAMAALSVAMILVTLIINAANWYAVRQEMVDSVSLIADNNGRYPRDAGGKGGGRRGFRESSYATRYFSVRQGGDGRYAAMNLDNIASVTEEQALELAQQAVEDGAAYGFMDGFIFCVRERGHGRDIVFVDCEAKLGAVRSLGILSALACLLGIGGAFVVVALLSRRAIEPLIESSERQKRFITDAGHELKTPLTVISAHMDLLQLEIGDNEWVAGTQRQVAHLRKLVGDLVTLAKMDEEGSALEPARFDLSAAVAETCEGFQAMAELSGRRLEQALASGIHMLGDEGAVRQLTGILLDNALKYAPEGSVVRAALTLEGRRARLSVQNLLAQPMDEASVRRLFDRFYRVDGARAKGEGPGGYGIGLAIAKAAAERQGGRIWARSSGTSIEFICQLPAVR